MFYLLEAFNFIKRCSLAVMGVSQPGLIFPVERTFADSVNTLTFVLPAGPVKCAIEIGPRSGEFLWAGDGFWPITR